MQRQRFIFLEKSKTQTIGNRKKKDFFSCFISDLIFHMHRFSENAQCFVGTFLKLNF